MTMRDIGDLPSTGSIMSTRHLTLALALAVPFMVSCAGARPSVQPSARPGASDAAARLAESPRHGEWVMVPAGGGDSVRAWVVYPERDTPAPVVLVVHEIFGLSDWIRSVADQVAADGFIAVAPDLLTGADVPRGPDGPDPDSARAAISRVQQSDVQRRLDAVAEYAMALPAALPVYGIMGFCWGGAASFAHAVHAPDLGASVVFYGTSPPTNELEHVRAPVLGLYAGDDERVNATIAAADSALTSLGRTFEYEIYDGAGHGFLRARDGRDGANLRASQAAWPRAIDWFREHLERAAPAPARPSDVTAFVDVNIIPMDRERVLEGQTVVISDGRIAEIGSVDELDVPDGAMVVNATGQYLMPGLSEMHAHIPPPQAGNEVIERTLYLYVAGGVTTIRGMLGNPAHLALRDQAAGNELVAPRIFTSGPSLNGNSAADPTVAASMVRDQATAGYDLLKLHPGLSRASFDAIASEAERVGITFAGHVSADVGLTRALEAGYASIDHLDGYTESLAGYGDGWTGAQVGFFGMNVAEDADMAGIPALAAATREAGVWNVPTQSLMENLASPEDPEVMARRPEMRYMPPATVAQWVEQKRSFTSAPGFTPERAERFVEVRRALIRELHAAGAGLLLGSDAPQWWNVPGFSVRRELEFLVAAGLTPYQALETGTRNPAIYFGEPDEWGTIEPGKAADLVLLSANPLDDIRNLWQQEGVMVRGRWMPQTELDRELEAIAEGVR
jgi:dienelactone hydrolase/imidazolonepropionase-like amidohydrolase